MSSVKIDRVNSELGRQISGVIANNIKDPRMEGAIVGVTKVATTPDLKYAKIYLSIYADNAEKQKECFDTIVRSKNFIRNMLKNTVQIRLLPELTFVIDDSCEYAKKIDNLLAQISKNKEE